MSGVRLLKDIILDKFDKLSQNWKDFTNKLSYLSRRISLKFSEITERIEEIKEKFESRDLRDTEILENLRMKKLIVGEMTFQNVDDFTKALWESHDMAQQAFQETADHQYYEIAMDTMLVIKEMEQLKEYLHKHGKL